MNKRCSRCGNEMLTDEFCKRKAAKDGLHPWCNKCRREDANKNYQLNKEEIKMAVQKYRDNNRELIRQRDRERYIKDSKKRAEQRKKYYQANREELIEKSNIWHRENRDKCREAEARYRDSNRDKRRIAGQRLYRETPLEKLRAKAVRNSQLRRARKRQTNAVFFTQMALEDKLNYWERKCWMCGAPMEAVDHVKPLAKGGPHVLANLRPVCKDCNQKKGAKWNINLSTYDNLQLIRNL